MRLDLARTDPTKNQLVKFSREFVKIHTRGRVVIYFAHTALTMHPSPAFFVRASCTLNKGKLIEESFKLRPMYTNLRS